MCVYDALLPIEACTVQGADSVVKDRLADEMDRVAGIMQLKQVEHSREHLTAVAHQSLVQRTHCFHERLRIYTRALLIYTRE